MKFISLGALSNATAAPIEIPASLWQYFRGGAIRSEIQSGPTAKPLRFDREAGPDVSGFETRSTTSAILEAYEKRVLKGRLALSSPRARKEPTVARLGQKVSR